MIAYCGLNCRECPAYLATKSDDLTLREKVAAEWSKMFNADIKAEEINCAGCRSVEGPYFSHCFECPMRLCAMERPIDTCAGCHEYPCDSLEEFFGYVPAARITLENLRQST